MNKKVALLTNIISPYAIPRFNRVAEADLFNIDDFFLAETENNRLWKVYKEKIKFNYKVLKGFQFYLGRERTIHFNFGLASLAILIFNAFFSIGERYLFNVGNILSILVIAAVFLPTTHKKL